MTNTDFAKENIRQVALKLGHLREKVVFLGGSVTALLIIDPAAPDVRETRMSMSHISHHPIPRVVLWKTN